MDFVLEKKGPKEQGRKTADDKLVVFLSSMSITKCCIRVRDRQRTKSGRVYRVFVLWAGVVATFLLRSGEDTSILTN